VSIETLIAIGLAVFVVLVAAGPILYRNWRRDRDIARKLARARELGTNETPSLHPRIDEGKCIGCEECVRNCPEQDVLVRFRHKAVVLNAVECVGHGVCERVCPVGAITLVVGTEKRGLELPRLNEVFETNVPGLFVVGELGGMGLIRNAIWQATQAVSYITTQPRLQPPGGVDVLVAGAGPAGLAAALAAQEAGLTFRIVDQETIGGSMLHYPRRKLVMTHPASLPGVGEFPFKEIEKEPLLEFWKKTASARGITVEEGTQLLRVDRDTRSFLARTNKGDIRSGRVILALGRRGTPRKLGVPGEQSSKVMYRLIEPHHHDGRRCAVIGGGSVAIESALSLAARPGTQVTLCHRRDTFAGARTSLIEQLLAAEEAGKLEILRNAVVLSIEPDLVRFDVGGQATDRPNSVVFVMIGGTPPYELLKASGVDLETKFGAPLVLRSA
jgi:thioredoxin reductase/Pyruvate/2-oxoacid:ferredoxin oxidoreductase delta subunit